jgi:hypothetical protein
MFLPPIPAEGSTFAPTKYLGMGIERFHQPGGAGFLMTYNKEHRRAFWRPLRASSTTRSGKLHPQSDDLLVLASYLPPGLPTRNHAQRDARAQVL